MAVATIPRGKSNGRATETPAAAAPSYQQVLVEQIDVGENVRVQPGELDDMAASIVEHGVLQPVKVVGPHKDGRFKLVYGQRRLLASRVAGALLIPAIVVAAGADVDHPGAKRSIEQLVENLQRADLNPIDEAKALRQVLNADPHLQQEELAKRLGRSPSWLSNSLRLLDLAPEVQQYVSDGRLSHSHAKAIAGLKDPKNQVSVAETAVKYDYSAKQVEANVKYQTQSSSTEPERKEQIRKKSERLAKKMLRVLEETGIPKDAQLTGLNSSDTDSKLIVKALKAGGWTGGVDGYMSGVYGRNPDEIGCDCVAYRWETYPSPMFTRCCVNKAHVEAYEAKKDQVEKQRVKELRDKAKRLTAVLARGLVGIDATTARLAIAAIFGSNLNYHVDQKGDPWKKLEEIADDATPPELAELIASTLIPTDQWGRTADSAGLASTINRLAAAPAKKAAAAE
jgi:ParB family chromosome partitioning protein